MRPVLLVLIAATAGVVSAWAAFAHQTDRCVLPFEAPQQLDPTNPSDARHLASDLAVVERVAERYREAIRRQPRVSNSVDARRNQALRPDRAYCYCTTILKEQIARTHGLQH